MGPMGADKMIPIDTQPIMMDIIVPTGGCLSLITYKITKKCDKSLNQFAVFNERDQVLSLVDGGTIPQGWYQANLRAHSCHACGKNRSNTV